MEPWNIPGDSSVSDLWLAWKVGVAARPGSSTED
jgi:hypothetical protein